MDKILGEISSKLDVIISLMLKSRLNSTDATIRDDAIMLHKHGVPRERIAGILGSTERSIGEYLRPGKAKERSKPKK